MAEGTASTSGAALAAALGNLLDPLPPLSDSPLTAVVPVAAPTCASQDRRTATLEATTSTASSSQNSGKRTPPKAPERARKRQRGWPPDVTTAAAAIRRGGGTPDTLFFADVPKTYGTDDSMRAVLPARPRELKFVRSAGRVLAWVSFLSEGDCFDTLCALRTGDTGLSPRLHRPKGQNSPAGQSPGGGTGDEGKARMFDTKLRAVLAAGGMGNTLMFRNLPLELECGEFENILSSLGQGMVCRPLRVRTAVSKSGKARNFWATYTGDVAARTAFCAMHGRQVSLRCGKCIRIAPMVHDDASDAESRKRRQREAALGTQQSVGDSRAAAASDSIAYPVNQVRPKNSLEQLESVLRMQPQLCLFLDSLDTP